MLLNHEQQNEKVEVDFCVGMILWLDQKKIYKNYSTQAFM